MKRTLSVLTALALTVVFRLPALADEPPKEDGKGLYAKKCAMCHGADGVAKSMAKGSANFNDPAFQQKETVEGITKITTEGKNRMPKFEGKLSAEQLKMIAAYVKTLGASK